MDWGEEIPEERLKPSVTSVFWVELFMQVRCQWQDLRSIWTHLMALTLLALLIGLVCGWGEQARAALSYSRLSVTLMTVSRFANVFTRDRQRYLLGESARVCFHPISVYLSKLLVVTVVYSAAYLPFTLIVYPLVGLGGGTKGAVTFMATLMLQQTAAISLGFVLSATIRDRRVAQTAAATLSVIILLLSGNIADLKQIPLILRWLQFLSFSFWAMQALLRNEFGSDPYYRVGLACLALLGHIMALNLIGLVVFSLSNIYLQECKEGDGDG